MRLPPRVLPITPGDVMNAQLGRLKSTLRVIFEAGAEGVLLREPRLSDVTLLELARAARELWVDGWVGVHDRVHVALAVNADAVHLGHRSLSPIEARSMLPAEMAIGHSQHAPELGLKSMEADYRFMSPIHSPSSKETMAEPIGIDPFVGRPLQEQTWALGGIGPEEVSGVLSTGVAGVAAIGSIFQVDDPAVGMEKMLRAARDHG